MKITSERSGWVVVNIGHPTTGTYYICEGTFAFTRIEAIRKFVTGSSASWKYWYRKYNFRCVRVNCTFQTWEIN